MGLFDGKRSTMFDGKFGSRMFPNFRKVYGGRRNPVRKPAILLRKKLNRNIEKKKPLPVEDPRKVDFKNVDGMGRLN